LSSKVFIRNSEQKTKYYLFPHNLKISHMVKKQGVPKRLTKEQMRKLLLSAKKKADKMPEEEGSFRLEVICKKTDIDKK
jgi:hypothetical protein